MAGSAGPFRAGRRLSAGALGAAAALPVTTLPASGGTTCAKEAVQTPSRAAAERNFNLFMFW